MAVTNIGNVAGKEVVEVYSSKTNTQIDRPVQELKAFTKTEIIQAGARATVSINFPTSDLAYWDETGSSWKVEAGTYQIKVGASSRDIRLTAELEI